MIGVLAARNNLEVKNARQPDIDLIEKTDYFIIQCDALMMTFASSEVYGGLFNYAMLMRYINED